MGNTSAIYNIKFTCCYIGDEMIKFETNTKPSYIMKYMINKDLLQQGDDCEIFSLRGMLCVLNIQGFITQSTYLRFNRLIHKALRKELKLNIYKDRK